MLYSYETAFGDTFPILGDPGAVSRVDKMFVVKVYRKIILGDTGAVSRVGSIKFIDPTNCPWVSEDVHSRVKSVMQKSVRLILIGRWSDSWDN